MSMKATLLGRGAWCAVAAFCAFGAQAAFDAGESFAKPESWAATAVDFTVDHKDDGFKFASQKRDIVNCLRPGAVAWHGVPVYETKLYFGPKGVERLELSLFNTGDARGGMGREELDALLETVRGKLLDGKGSAPKPETRKLKGKEQLKQSVQTFPKADPPAELAWGVEAPKGGSFRVNFVRLTMMAPGTKMKAAAKPVGNKLTDHVKKDASSGDVWISDVPMVDQGQKGYCAAAVTERVLRYYGQTVDEHEFAQQAGTSARGGTSVSEMRVVVQQLGRKCGLNMADVHAGISSIADVDKMLQKYNRAAKATGKSQISREAFTNGHVIDVGGIFGAMDTKTVKKMRTDDKGGFQRFQKGVKDQVKLGIPLVWGVTLGRYPEPELANLQGTGGHMRLIIGYNEKSKEILYSDTWGAGHELKRMPEDWAWAITDNLFYLKPVKR